MYYSKSASGAISVPKNYSGSTFRTLDEIDHRTTLTEDDPFGKTNHKTEKSNTQNADFYLKNDKIREKNTQNSNDFDPKSNDFSKILSIFSSISVEDLLILGLIFVIHHDNPHDATLLILLALLLAK